MKKISYKNKEIGFKVRGEGFPVVFIHGMLMDHQRNKLYTNQLVKSGFKVIEVDIPGHGSSTYWTPRMNTLISSIKKIIDELNIDEYHCAGLSMGANISSELAINDIRVKKTVMVVPVISKRNSSKFFAKMVWKTVTNGKVTPYEFFKNTYKTNTSPDYPREKIESRIEEILSQRWEAFFGGVVWNGQINVAKNIEDLGNKVLVISGKFDQLAPLKYAKKVSTNLKTIPTNHSDITEKILGFGKNNLLVEFFNNKTK
ncbi:MAG: alpha/beta hydrolase [Candidatus Altiarchaeota archaeon]|nr:alpha/beta hydrolase [Candidatus Altiarchaeota archaeon]